MKINLREYFHLCLFTYKYVFNLGVEGEGRLLLLSALCLQRLDKAQTKSQ